AEDAGVADEDIELAPALVDGRPQRVDLVMHFEVQGEQRGAAAAGPDLIVDLLEGAGSAADQDQMRAFPGVRQRHSPADATRGSGDEGKPAGKAWRVFHRWVSDPLGPTPLLQRSTLRHGVGHPVRASAPPAWACPSTPWPSSWRRRRPSARLPCSCRNRAWPRRRRARLPAWLGRWPPWPHRAPCRWRVWPCR